MGDEARARRLTAIARKWLVDPRVGHTGDLNPAASEQQELSCMAMAGARVSLAEPGRVVCSLRVRAPLTDAEGNWHAGAIAAAVDNMSAAVVFTVDGAPTVTVQYSLSYFSPAHPDEEVEMEARVESRKGKLTSAAVEVRKKESGELIAIGRQWMTPIAPAWLTKSNKSSKL